MRNRFSRLYGEIHSLNDYLMKEYGPQLRENGDPLRDFNQLAWEIQEDIIKRIKI